MNKGFAIPLLDFLRAFDTASVLLNCGLPLVLGLIIGILCKRRTGIAWACVSGAAAVVLTVLYQFRQQVHTFDYLGFLLGPSVTALFIGVLIGVIIRAFTKGKK
jgi:hypothetical protein